MKTVKAQAPMRVDFAGGTLDLSPLYLFHPGALTVNSAVELYAHVSVQESKKMTVISEDQNITAVWDSAGALSWHKYPNIELPIRIIKSFGAHGPIAVTIRSEAPAGSGLGGSSALAIALTAGLARWYKKEFSHHELIECAKSLETQTIKVPTGYQDYWAAVYGGTNAYEIALDRQVMRTPLGSQKFLQELERHILLIYAGKPRFSGANNWKLFKRHIDGDRAIFTFFEQLKDNALAMKAAFENESMRRIGEALNRDWEIRKNCLPSMTTPEIETFAKAAFRAGAFAFRVCGAGGGGCVLLLVSPEKQERVTALTVEMGMKKIQARISETGLSVVEG